MGLFLKLFGIEEYLLDFLTSFDFLKLIVEEYKLLEVKLLGLSFVVPILRRTLTRVYPLEEPLLL